MGKLAKRFLQAARLGDKVEWVTEKTGLKRLVERKGPCGGCGRRKARWNGEEVDGPARSEVGSTPMVGEGDLDMIVISYLSDAHACGWVRGIVPAAAVNANPDFRCRVFPKLDLVYSDWAAAELMVFHRKSTEEWVRLLAEAKKRGMPVLYEIDDDVWNIPPEFAKPHDFFSAEDVRGAMQQIVQGCDGVIVSTAELAQVVDAEFPDKRIYVIENAVDLRVFADAARLRQERIERDAERDVPVVIGWHASQSHVLLDLPVVRHVLPRLLREFPKARLRLVGWPNIENWPELQPVADQVRCDGWASQWELPYKLEPFDIGIAPLMPNHWNVSKSPQKMLEYGALSIPAVASPAPCYQRFADTGGAVLLPAENRPEAWYDTLRSLIVNPQARRDHGARMRQTVEQKWNVTERAHTWRAVFGVHAKKPVADAPAKA